MTTTQSAHTTLQFLGAAGTVTGSKYLLSAGDRRILVDFGMFQGTSELRQRNWAELGFDARAITDVLVTHAHMDHVGLLPRLIRAGYRGPIFATEATARLAEIVLRDGAKLQEQDAEDANKGGWSKHAPALPLYTTADVEATMPLFVTIPYDEAIDLEDGIVARWTRAAHIIGSASITVWTPTASVVFSGDLGRHDHPVLKPRETAPGGDIALIESTYGDREHPDLTPESHEALADIIRRTVQRGGSVLIPAFAVDRTEVVLKTLAELRRAGRIPALPVYVDSPMANLALDVYRSMPDELRDDLRPDDLVEFPGLHSIRTPDESRALTGNRGRAPSIIIAASGMATGGRVLHHLEAMLPDKRNAVVLSGYQAVGTRGRQLAEGATKLKMRGQYVPVKAEVLRDEEFSVHGDRSDLLDWLRELDPRPRTVYCVHGEQDAAEAFARTIEAELPEIDAIVPGQGEVVLLDGVREGGPVPPAAHRVDRSAGGKAQRRATVPVTAAPSAPLPAEPAVAAPAAPSPAAPPAAARGPIAAGAGYRLATGEDPAALGREVEAALAEGYALHGAPQLGELGGRPVWYQALTR